VKVGVPLQGAKVGEGAFIDTADFMDTDCLEIGKDAVVGEGATVIGHAFKDGHLVFSKVPPPPPNCCFLLHP